MPIEQPIGRQRGLSLPLLLIMLFWFIGSQSLAAQSERSSASETGWQITGQAGRVSIRSPGRTFWQRAWPGARILPGSQITTYNGSHLELAGAGDQATASGPSRFTLPDAEHNGVRVHQDAGTLRYKVQSAPKRHFEVQTPHFSTVVKGTTFLVSIDRASAIVAVQEGRVLILDPNGEPLAELTAGQTGRVAAHPGTTMEISTASDPSFETGTEPGAGSGSPDHGNTAVLQTTGETAASSRAAISEERAIADVSLLERIGGLLADIAAQISTGDAQTTEGARLGSDRGGGGREQESWSNGSSTAHGSRDDEKGHGKGGGKGEGKGKGKGGKGKGNGKGKGKGNGKGEGRGKGHGHDRGKGRDVSAYIHLHLDHDDRGHLIAWNERR